MNIMLNLNYNEATMLMDILSKINEVQIYDIATTHEMSVNISLVLKGIKKVLYELQNFNKNFSMSTIQANALKDWLGFQILDDTAYLLGYAFDDERLVDLAGDTDIIDMISLHDKVLGDLYSDLALASTR